MILNKPAMPARWYLWDGGFLALGRSADAVGLHSHHALQIVMAIEGAPAVREPGGDWQTGPGIIVPPDVEHSYDGRGATGAMLFVDPESLEGVRVCTDVGPRISFIPEERLAPCVEELRKFCEGSDESMEIGALIRHCVQQVCGGPLPVRRLDPRVTTVLKKIRESEELRVSLESAAATVSLSPSRFAHLFKQQVGLPFRRYILWRKLSRAILASASEETIAAAAHAAGFADSAHLTRTFYQMFGIAPSAMMRGQFFEISSPFE